MDEGMKEIFWKTFAEVEQSNLQELNTPAGNTASGTPSSHV